MQVAADCAPHVGAERRSSTSQRTLGVCAEPKACTLAGAAWQRRARFWVVASLAGGALTSCGGKAESGWAPGSGEGTPRNTDTPDPSESSSGGVPPSTRAPPEETCAENPLLAYCTRPEPVPRPTPPAAPSPAPPAVQPPPAPTQAATTSVTQVQAVLSDSCGYCHGGYPSPERCGTCDGMFYVENLRRLIQSGHIVPCHWQDSLLYQRIADGSMPPAGTPQDNVATLEDEDVDLVGDFVNGMCSNLTDGGPADTPRANIERWLGADCGSCHGLAAALSGGFAPSALDGVGDIAELITDGLIVPCDADGSALVRVLRDESMPPPGFNGPRPERAELTELIAFINRPCARR